MATVARLCSKGRGGGVAAAAGWDEQGDCWGGQGPPVGAEERLHRWDGWRRPGGGREPAALGPERDCWAGQTRYEDGEKGQAGWWECTVALVELRAGGNANATSREDLSCCLPFARMEYALCTARVSYSTTNKIANKDMISASLP